MFFPDFEMKETYSVKYDQKRITEKTTDTEKVFNHIQRQPLACKRHEKIIEKTIQFIRCHILTKHGLGIFSRAQAKEKRE